MVPPFRPDEPVPFHKLDAAAFQRLTRDLLAKEPGVATAGEYGINGQAQHGIDVLGYLAHGEGCVVAQCKCYEEIAPADIDAATKDFLSHWDRWKGWKVRRFVLVVACPLRRRELQDAVQAQRRAFKRRGIEYQAWSAEVLRDKLAPHRPIAERYVPREWVDHICGRPPGADLAEAAAVVNVALTSQVTSYKRIISDQAWRDLERLRKEWAEGRRQRVRREVDSLREDAGRWGALSEEVRAEYLRFRAGLELMSPGAGGVALAERLAAEARGLAPSPEDAVLQGLLARARGDWEEALELLRDTATGQARLHEAALLLELGRSDEALGALEGDFAEEHRAEAHRLRALAHLLLKRLERARMEARLALEAEPANLAARMVGGVVAFYSAVSPAAVPEQVPAWPPPVPWDLVRRDADSRARLAEAREQFEALLSRAEREEQERWGLRAWRLAALAVDPERGGEAVERCRRELEDQPGQPALVLWALSRNWPVDLQPSLEAFRREPTPNGVIALVIHALSQDDVRRALALLDEHRGVFAEAGHEGLWRFWKVRALAVAGEFDAAEALIRAEPPLEDPEALAAAVLRARAEREGGWGELASCLVERFRATGEGVYLYEACQAAARQGDWAFAAARARELVEAVATPAALRLAVIACHNAGDFAQARGLLEDFQGLLAGLPPDPDLRKIHVECLRALGIVPKALSEAQALAEEEPTADNLIRLAGLQLGAADVRGLAATVRRLKNLPELAPRQALAAAVTAAVLRVTVASGRQQQALLQGGALQAELRRGLGAARQAVGEGGFLLPLRGGPLGLEFLQAVPDSAFTVLGVSAEGLVVRLLEAGYDPRALRRAVVVDAGGNGYVYALRAARVLDGASGLWALEGEACARPGLPARGVGAALARLGSGAALASFGAAGVEATGLYFQREGEAPERLLGEATVRLRYAYRAADGEALFDDAPLLTRSAGGRTYRLAALGVELGRAVGQGPQVTARRLSGDVLLEEAGLGLRGLDCGPAPAAPPVGGGEWRVEIAGLDTGVAASVGVSGPGGYAATLTASATLSGLAQGTYRLQAAAVVHPAFPSVRYRPVQPPEGSALSVAVGGGTRPLTRVSYRRLGGRLRWEVAGLPGGLAAEVEAEGPFAGYRYSAASGRREEAAEPGPYTLRFGEVRAPDGSGVWRPDPPSLRAEVPSEGVGEAGTVRYRFERYPGMLELDVRFEGGAPGVNPQVCVYPSDGSAVDPNAQVYGCP